MMVYNILIIDSDQSFQMHLTELLDRTIPRSHVFRAKSFITAIDILEEEEINLMYIDINISKANSSLISEKMQKYKQNPLTIFLLSEQEETQPLKITGVEPIGYFIKPKEYQASSKAGNTILDKSDEKKKDPGKGKETIMLSTATGVYPIIKDSILAIERTQRNFLNVYTEKRTLKQARGILAEISNQLPDDFVFINRKCIINRTAITRIMPKTREIYLDIGSSEVVFSCSQDKIKNILIWFNSFKSS